MNLGEKYEIFPTLEEKVLINKSIGCCRFVWNWALGKVKEDPKFNYTKSDHLTALKKEFLFLREPNAQALVAELRHLRDALKKFFDNCKKKIKGKKGYPKFKPRGVKESFSNQQNNIQPRQNRIEDLGNGWGYLTIIKFNKIKIRLHRQPRGELGTVTISKTPTGRYFASISVSNNSALPAKPEITEATTKGIDVGISNFMTFDDGTTIDNPRFLQKNIGRLAVLQRRLSLKKERNKDWKNSRRYQEARLKVAKLHEDIQNMRRDFEHKITYQLTHTDGIDSNAIETLNVKGMMANHKLAKHIGDAAWYETARQLKYKSDWYGKNVLEIGRFEPSSRTCNKCDYYNEKLTLSDRSWDCPGCGEHHNRDENAAKVIKKIALKSYGRTLGQESDQK